MPVRMPQVHLSHVPRHVVRRKRYFESSGNALPMHFIHIFHPHGHPRTFVARFISIVLKCSRIRSLAASALRALAKKNLAFARANRSKCRRRSPIPAFSPAPLFKPRKTCGNVAHIQYRRQPFCLHGAKSYHRSPCIKPSDALPKPFSVQELVFSSRTQRCGTSIPSLHRISRVLPSALFPVVRRTQLRGFGVCSVEVPMWRKSEDTKSAPESASESKPRSNSPAQSATPAAASSPTAATVSRGVIIKGEISGQGDFFLDGTFEGKVNLPEGSFTAGPNAHVTAEIEAREIIVLGEVIGTLKARERVHISSTGRLTGDMDTRGIVIEDGAILHSKVATPHAAAPKLTAGKAAPPEAASAGSATASPDGTTKEDQTAHAPSSAKEAPRTKGAAAAGDS